MKSFLLSLGVIVISFTITAQTRIDSSFAFGTNPAKKYSIFIPLSYNPANANPMIVGFHPFNTSRWDAESWCDTLTNFASMNNLILVCPDGDSDGNITDSIDYAFTTDLIDSMKVWYNIDAERVYALGFSFGGKAVYEYGLNNVETFGGFIPIGAAVNGASFVSSVIHNASQRPFYLVHGANDSPNSRFYPMLTALNNNCAIVDSILMAGVGHTIDFPNRNSILSDAYLWVDSVNVTPRTSSFSLNSPLNLASLTIKGFHEYLQDFKWGHSPLEDTCGTLKYEVMFDLPNANFSNPLITSLSNNNGTDTVLSIKNEDIDSLLVAFSIPINSTLTLDWTVRSNILNKHSDTAKSFRITFVRKKLGFSVSSPSDSNIVTLENGQNQFFNWQDINHYISVTYELMFDDTSADFSNPLVSNLSTSNGSSSSLNQSHESLYYDLMFLNGSEIGDSIMLKWRALAYDTIMSEFSLNERTITFIQGNVGFKLFEPIDNSLLNSKKGTDYVFKWDSVLLSNIRYEWRFDTLGIDLLDTASFTLGSANDSLNSRIDITFDVLDSMMNFYGVDYLDTLYGQWTSRAIYDGGDEFSLNTYNVAIVRAHPVGINEFLDAEEISLFPNPANDQFIFSTEDEWTVFKIFNSNGAQVMQEFNKNRVKQVEVDVSKLPEGAYILNVNGNDHSKVGRFVISR